MYNITDKDIKYCEWITRKVYGLRGMKPSEDDMQDAMEKICLAAISFDEGFGVKFSSYAKGYIRKSLQTKIYIRRPNGNARNAEIFKMGKRKNNSPDYDVMDKFLGKHDVEKRVINKDRIEKALARFPEKIQAAIIRHIVGGEKYADIAKDYGYGNHNSLNKTVRDWCKRTRGTPLTELVCNTPN